MDNLAERPENQRKAVRETIKHAGVMLHGAGLAQSMKCMIENRSTRGALLIFDAEAVVPRRFVVFDMVDQQCNTAEIVWRKGAAAGVAFLRTFKLDVLKRG